jgi:phosphatidylinositol alpha-1,6-mannosyltransferase
VDRIVADCHATADHVTGERMSASRPAVICDCVDLERFTPGACKSETLGKYGLPDKRRHFVVLSLGRLAQRAAHKGYDRLIAAVAQARRGAPDIRLVIAGQGDDRPRLERIAARLGIAGYVTFPGSIEEDDLPDVYRCASLFSLVSDKGHLRGEGLPLTPLEAISCGAPILVGDQDGSQEAVLEAVGGFANGFVVRPFDIDGHARRIVELAQSPALLKGMAERARGAAEAAFGYRRFVDQHRAIYGEGARADRGPQSFRSRAGATGSGSCSNSTR